MEKKIRNRKPFKYKETNLHYFEKIDSKDKAYFLGLLMSDGALRKNGFCINLEESDSQILQIFANYLNYKGGLKTIIPKNTNWKTQKSLNIWSIKICNDLQKWGIVKNKDFKTYLPPISEEFHSHFIRGVFDGDGCVRIDKRSNSLQFGIVGFINFIKELQQVLMKNCDLNEIKLTHCKSNKAETVGLEYSGNKNCKRIYEWLYKDCEDLYLTRKKEKFELILNNYDYRATTK